MYGLIRFARFPALQGGGASRRLINEALSIGSLHRTANPEARYGRDGSRNAPGSRRSCAKGGRTHPRLPTALRLHGRPLRNLIHAGSFRHVGRRAHGTRRRLLIPSATVPHAVCDRVV